MTLGRTIALYRKKLGITQDALAQQLEVTNQAVSKWELDQSCPDIMLLPRLADLFGISIDRLFGREPEAPKAAPQVTIQTDLPWEDDGNVRGVLYVGTRLLQFREAGKPFDFELEGDAKNVYCDFSVKCQNVEGNVEAGGNVSCGDVGGSVDASNSVSCGEVNGRVDAGGNVSCGEVNGSVDAGNTVTCAEVNGNVNAGSGVQCGDVNGNVDAGGSVECHSVGQRRRWRQCCLR